MAENTWVFFVTPWSYNPRYHWVLDPPHGWPSKNNGQNPPKSPILIGFSGFPWNKPSILRGQIHLFLVQHPHWWHWTLGGFSLVKVISFFLAAEIWVAKRHVTNLEWKSKGGAIESDFSSLFFHKAKCFYILVGDDDIFFRTLYTCLCMFVSWISHSIEVYTVIILRSCTYQMKQNIKQHNWRYSRYLNIYRYL